MKLMTRIYQISGFDFEVANFFKLFGLSSEFATRSVVALHFIYICINLKYQFNFQVQLFKHPDVLGNTTNACEMLLPLLCHFTLILESFYKRQKEERIKNLMTKIRCNLECNLHTKLISLPYGKFLALFVVNSLIYVSVLIMVFRIAGKHSATSHSKAFLIKNFVNSTHGFIFPLTAWRIHVMFVLLSFIHGNLFDFYYSSRMHFIETCSILIQRKLISRMMNVNTESLKLLKETSSELWLLSELLNERFAFTLLTGITTKLALLVIDIYWIYMRVIHSMFNLDFIRM